MDHDARNDLVRRIFAMATGKAEDAAGVAAEGQGADVSTQRATALAVTIQGLGMEIALLAEAAEMLVRVEAAPTR